MSETILNRTTPPYYFSLTSAVEEIFEKAKRTERPIFLDEKELTPEVFLPSQSRPKDTGYDVRCAEPNGLELIPGHYFTMKLGIRMFAPEGWWLKLVPRSGTFKNYNVHALYGTIDETYEGELCFVGQFVPDQSKLFYPPESTRVEFGQKFAQVIPSPRWEMPVIALSNQEIDQMYRERGDIRGAGGFGSSTRV